MSDFQPFSEVHPNGKDLRQTRELEQVCPPLLLRNSCLSYNVACSRLSDPGRPQQVVMGPRYNLEQPLQASTVLQDAQPTI
jgi:hypothetical protein